MYVNRLFKDRILPEKNEMHYDQSQAKSILQDIGMDFKSYHACPKILFSFDTNTEILAIVQNVANHDIDKMSKESEFLQKC